MTGADRIAEFRRHVRAARGIHHRHDSGQLTGRNSDATAQALDYHVTRAAAILRADALDDDASPLCDYLDSGRGAALSELWSRVERRHAGLPS